MAEFLQRVGQSHVVAKFLADQSLSGAELFVQFSRYHNHPVLITQYKVARAHRHPLAGRALKEDRALPGIDLPEADGLGG